MNANLTLSEIITIALVILIVFGPQRLPEMARKAGEIIGKLRTAAASIRDEFSAEYEEIAKPLTDLDAEIKAVKSDLKDSLPQLDPLTEGLEAAAAAGTEDASGNGQADPFEAELAAARLEAEAELADDKVGEAPSADQIEDDTEDDAGGATATAVEVETDESESA